MARALRERLESWVHCGHTGGVIVGEARLGKTRALEGIGDQLTNRSGQPIHAFYTHYGRRDVETIRAVFAKVARALDFQIKRQTSDVLLDQIVMRLAEAALANDTRQVVLMVDEAQLLTINQLNAFAEIYNDLAKLRINCVVFFVANQDQFASLGRALLRRENRYLRERFFNNVDYFFGIRSEAELSECLAGYDHYVVCEETQQTAIEYFCPKLVDQGWHLAQIAPVYWHHFRKDYGVPLELTSWGMAQFVRATNLLVMDYLPHCEDSRDGVMLEACVIKSLSASGLMPSLVQLVEERA
ncbi:MAG: ATP-binding protein [Marinobacter sp.]|nr:ATP-binding protein [Marinobacter sp.]